MKSNFFEDESGIFYKENEIVFGIFKGENVIVDLELHRHTIKNRIKVADGKSYPTFVDARKVKYWTREAKKYSMSDPEALAFIIALAVLINSFALKISVNWAMKFFPPPFPMKAFNNESEALAWLEKFKK
jgi:hypothetical protein